MYLTFQEYIVYGGTLTEETTFYQYEFKVRKLIDGITSMRVAHHMSEISEAVKRCMVELIKLEKAYDDASKNIIGVATTSGTGGLLQSFTNDGYTETSMSGGTSNLGAYLLELRKSTDETQKKVVYDYLAYEFDDNQVPLLYRGVYSGETL